MVSRIRIRPPHERTVTVREVPSAKAVGRQVLRHASFHSGNQWPEGRRIGDQ